MNNITLYIIAFGIFVVSLLTYLVFHFLKKDSDKFKKIFLIVLGALTAFAFFVVLYHVQGIMKAERTGKSPIFNVSYGCLNLVGEPYGDNRFTNLLALLSITLFYPAALVAVISNFYKCRPNILMNRYFSLPITALSIFTLFHLKNALIGTSAFNYKAVFIAIFVGLVFTISFFNFHFDIKKERKVGIKSTLYAVGLFIIVLACCIPSYFYSSIIDTNILLFDSREVDLRTYNFSFTHRIWLYILVGFPFLIYFYGRNQDLKTRKSILLYITLGALIVFLSHYGAERLFYHSGGKLKMSMTALPIHLCHTALFILPICTICNFKKLFYFTYFINVFGAVGAMLFPNVGEYYNIVDPEVIMFWYNHISVFVAPLLGVALGIFEKAKFKSVVYSLVTFAIYFIFILFLNAWLSNYVPGYNPNEIGTGTDYFFINNDYILDAVLGGESYKVMNIKATFYIKDLIFVFYPLYQVLFFISYIFIAFILWYIYSLFFYIADSHHRIHNKLMKFSISKKEYMASIKDIQIDHDEVRIEFDHVFKKYDGNDYYSVDDFTYIARKGQIIGFIGPNGAGKSTLIKCLIGLQDMSDGDILVNGYSVNFENQNTKNIIGYVPDHYHLYDGLTGREYINMIADVRNVSLSDRENVINKYAPLLHIDTALDDQIETYSHGMKQKIALIASIIHSPKIWILDEPLTGLDSESIYEVKKCMKEYAEEGNIVLFSSHIIDVVTKLCTHIILIKNGKLMYSDEIHESEDLEILYLSYAKEEA